MKAAAGSGKQSYANFSLLSSYLSPLVLLTCSWFPRKGICISKTAIAFGTSQTHCCWQLFKDWLMGGLISPFTCSGWMMQNRGDLLAGGSVGENREYLVGELFPGINLALFNSTTFLRSFKLPVLPHAFPLLQTSQSGLMFLTRTCSSCILCLSSCASQAWGFPSVSVWHDAD